MFTKPNGKGQKGLRRKEPMMIGAKKA